MALAAAVGWTVAFFGAGGCGNKLEEAQCGSLRGQAFEIINAAHICADDAECVPVDWPGCAKPVSSKNKTRVLELKEKYEQGKCVEAKATCRDTPEIYCKQGLCVFRELVGQTNPTK